MAKKNAPATETAESPYVTETPKAKKSLKETFSSRGAKTAGIVAGSALALTAAFGIGLTAGHAQGPAFGHDQMGQGQFGGDRDGDHGGQFGPGGHRDGDKGGQFNPNMQPPTDPNAPAPAPQPTN
ncbi:MAG: hypothetical protein ACKOWE_06325 [Micrococcales bacterium]